MYKILSKFRTELRYKLIDICWRQWQSCYQAMYTGVSCLLQTSMYGAALLINKVHTAGTLVWLCCRSDGTSSWTSHCSTHEVVIRRATQTCYLRSRSVVYTALFRFVVNRLHFISLYSRCTH